MYKQNPGDPMKKLDSPTTFRDDSPMTKMAKDGSNPLFKYDTSPLNDNHDDFNYKSDMGNINPTGTAYKKSGKVRVDEYQKGGKNLKKGDTYERGGFQTPKKVVDTGRDASGRKKSGRTGTVDVEVKKGDIRFSS